MEEERRLKGQETRKLQETEVKNEEEQLLKEQKKRELGQTQEQETKE